MSPALSHKAVLLVAALAVALVWTAELSDLDSAAMYAGRRGNRGRRGSRLQTMGSFMIATNRAGNDELEEAQAAERHEDLGASQLQEDAAKVELSKPRHKIFKTSRGGEVDCPKDKTCELVCKGRNACRDLKGGTGHFARITCEGRDACAIAKLPDCPKDKTCELKCKGRDACHGLKGGTGHYARITCDGRQACIHAKMPDCPKDKTCALKCKGMKACSGLKQGGTGHFARITCEGREACREAKMPDCPKDKTCELKCKGWDACQSFKAGTGHFARITCEGLRACREAKLSRFARITCGRGDDVCLWAQLDCPKDKTCELECKGFRACREIKAGISHFARITCEGDQACRGAKMPDCPKDKTCEMVCHTHACGLIKHMPMGNAGSILDILGNKVPASLLPKPAALSPKMTAFRAVGVKGYPWPPEQCKDQLTETHQLMQDARNLWFCPSARKCAKSERECGGEVHARWGSKLGTKEAHQMPTEPQQHIVQVTRRNGQRQVEGYFFGKKMRTRVSSKVMEEAGAGYQGLSCMQLGGLRTLGGTMVSVDPSQVIFTLPQGARPNYCIRLWAPLLSEDRSVVPVIVEICDGGRAQVQLPPGVTTSGATLSLSSVKFVPFEVSGGVQFQSVWKNPKGTHRYYHKLDMGSGAMCVLSGTIRTTWGATSSQTIGQLDPECTKGYKEGFRIIASVEVEGKQVWVQKGAASPFQLFLRGTDHLELAIWTSLGGITGKAVTVNLDGITLASGRGPKQCLSPHVLGDSFDLENNSVDLDNRASKAPMSRTSANAGGNSALVSTLTLLEEESKQKAQALEVSNKHASETKELKNKLSQGASKMKELKRKVSEVGTQLKANIAKAATIRASLKVGTDHKQNLPSAPPTEDTARSDFDGCRQVRNSVNTTQPGFAPRSILKPTNIVIMGADAATRTCVLRGVVKFTSIDSTAIAFLDPNYRDPTTRMPFCFPMATMIFLASVTDSNGSQQLARTVALQIEPHGRMVIIGKEPKDVSVRLDNIMYHPLMEFQSAPQSCAPYCFPAGREGENEMGMAGCVKYCTPTQYVRQEDGSLKLSNCKCTMMKRLDCYKHVSDDPEVLSGVKAPPTVCGQFKKLMDVSDPKKCEQICAGQLVSF